MSMAKSLEPYGDVPTRDDYFYFISPNGSGDITTRRDFRKLMRTYFTLDEVVYHSSQIMTRSVKDALIATDFSTERPVIIYFLMTIASAYGINENNYPYLVDDNMAKTYQTLLSKYEELICKTGPERQI